MQITFSFDTVQQATEALTAFFGNSAVLSQINQGIKDMNSNMGDLAAKIATATSTQTQESGVIKQLVTVVTQLVASQQATSQELSSVKDQLAAAIAANNPDAMNAAAAALDDLNTKTAGDVAALQDELSKLTPPPTPPTPPAAT